MDTLEPHRLLATTVLYYLVALGMWGILLGVRGSGPTPSYRGALVIAEAAILVQLLLGVATFVGHGPPPWIHILYGVALALAIPLAATMVREGSPRRTALTLGVVAFFAAGLVIRGMTTA